MDMAAIVLTTPPDRLDDMRVHYRDVLGFEEQFFFRQDDGSGMGLFSYGPSHFYMGTPGFADLLPEAICTGVLMMVKVPHASSLREILLTKGADVVGELRQSTLMGIGREALEGRMKAGSGSDEETAAPAEFFDVRDPTGHVTRFMTLAPQVEEASTPA